MFEHVIHRYHVTRKQLTVSMETTVGLSLPVEVERGGLCQRAAQKKMAAELTG